ncbi:MAG: M3 family oligoendopeptidase [Chloroflexota bacterium]
MLLAARIGQWTGAVVSGSGSVSGGQFSKHDTGIGTDLALNLPRQDQLSMSTETSASQEFLRWTWQDIAPHYADLHGFRLDPNSVEMFLAQWSALADRIHELGQRLKVATDANTADEDARARYAYFVETISAHTEEAEQRLREKLLASGLEPEGMQVPLRRMRADMELYRAANLPLLTDETLLAQRYFEITGAQNVEWEDKTIPVTELRSVLEETDRHRRETAWRLGVARRARDRSALDEVWVRLLDARRQIGANAGCTDYRTYRWRDLKRFDYTPDDAKSFHQSVENVVVPAVARRYERRRRLLQVDSLRPWDLVVDPHGRRPLQPYQDISDLVARASTIFHCVDSQLGQYFDTMREEQLLDLESRENKAPTGYCTIFTASRRPFIFMVASGTRLDVETLMHESGHAFHAFEMSALPHFQQRNFDMPIEFAEVGSMAMEFLTEPYLDTDHGGFYSREDAVRSRVDHLEERVLVLWARLVIIDAFQHWAYEHAEEAIDPRLCDATWLDLTRRFLPIIDWSGLEAEIASGWRDVLHIFTIPFYIIEYALALLGAVQVWANAQRDPKNAVRLYRHALSLGGTRTLPELFEAAGARFAFDEQTLSQAVEKIEATLAALEQAGGPGPIA